jgi:hypothetical protein
MKNSRKIPFYVLTLQLALTGYAKAGATQDKLSGRVNAIVAEVGMATAEGLPQAPTINAPKAEIFSSDESYFNQLIKLYDKGDLPSKEDVTGWFTGRCYKYDAQNEPIGGLLAAGPKENANGPLFPEPVFRMVDQMNGNVDYFDSITPSKESEINFYLSSDQGARTTVTETEKSFASKTTSGNLEYRVRRNGSYLIEKVFFPDDNGYRAAGAPLRLCYYFQKVR